MHFTEAKSILSVQNGMNLYRGCTHGCLYCLLRLGVGIGIMMMHGRIHLSGLLVEGDVGALLATQFATDRREQIAWLNFCHNLYIFMVRQYVPLTEIL